MPIKKFRTNDRPASWGSRICNEGYKTGIIDAIMVVENMIYEENTQRKEFYGKGSSMYNEEFSDGWLECLRTLKKRLKKL